MNGDSVEDKMHLGIIRVNYNPSVIQSAVNYITAPGTYGNLASVNCYG